MPQIPIQRLWFAKICLLVLLWAATMGELCLGKMPEVRDDDRWKPVVEILLEKPQYGFRSGWVAQNQIRIPIDTMRYQRALARWEGEYRFLKDRSPDFLAQILEMDAKLRGQIEANAALKVPVGATCVSRSLGPLRPDEIKKQEEEVEENWRRGIFHDWQRCLVDGRKILARAFVAVARERYRGAEDPYQSLLADLAAKGMERSQVRRYFADLRAMHCDLPFAQN